MKNSAFVVFSLSPTGPVRFLLDSGTDPETFRRALATALRQRRRFVFEQPELICGELIRTFLRRYHVSLSLYGAEIGTEPASEFIYELLYRADDPDNKTPWLDVLDRNRASLYSGPLFAYVGSERYQQGLSAPPPRPLAAPRGSIAGRIHKGQAARRAFRARIEAERARKTSYTPSELETRRSIFGPAGERPPPGRFDGGPLPADRPPTYSPAAPISESNPEPADYESDGYRPREARRPAKRLDDPHLLLKAKPGKPAKRRLRIDFSAAHKRPNPPGK